MLALPRTAEPILKALRAKSLVREVDDQPQPFGDAFAAFLERERRKVRSISGGEQSTTLRDLTGKTLGSYRVLEPIGRGGMAEVYKGYHSMLDRYVSIKVLLAHLVKDSSFMERFQREAAAVARLRHHNIVQVHDFGIYEGVTYMVMEYFQGQTLKDRLTALRIKGEEQLSPHVERLGAEAARSALANAGLLP